MTSVTDVVNPYDPDNQPRYTFDENGGYTVFTGKHCKAPGCGVLLTSRNRNNGKLKCVDHSHPSARRHAELRNHHEGIRSFTLSLPDVRHVKVHRALRLWTISPTNETYQQELAAAMVDFELFYRFSNLPTLTPPKPLQAKTSPQPPFEIPFEEPPFPGEERMTRSGFRVLCEEYGINQERTQ